MNSPRGAGRSSGQWGSNMWGSKHSDPYAAMEAGDVSLADMGDFADSAVRKGFIRKVFGILFVQLLITTAVCAAFMTTTGLKEYMMDNPWPLFASMGVSFGTIIAMMCNTQLARTFPQNYILLGIFTAAESVMVGTVCMMSNPQAVLIAAAATTVIVAGLTVYAMQTKYDFTMQGGVMVGVLLAFLIVSIVYMFFPRIRGIELLMGGAGALIFSAFLVIDVQMLMNGRRVQISPDDYILGALNLYLDILNIFLYILRFVNASRE